MAAEQLPRENRSQRKAPAEGFMEKEEKFLRETLPALQALREAIAERPLGEVSETAIAHLNRALQESGIPAGQTEAFPASAVVVDGSVNAWVMRVIQREGKPQLEIVSPAETVIELKKLWARVQDPKAALEQSEIGSRMKTLEEVLRVCERSKIAIASRAQKLEAGGEEDQARAKTLRENFDYATAFWGQGGFLKEMGHFQVADGKRYRLKAKEGKLEIEASTIEQEAAAALLTADTALRMGHPPDNAYMAKFYEKLRGLWLCDRERAEVGGKKLSKSEVVKQLIPLTKFQGREHLMMIHPAPEGNDEPFVIELWLPEKIEKAAKAFREEIEGYIKKRQYLKDRDRRSLAGDLYAVLRNWGIDLAEEFKELGDNKIYVPPAKHILVNRILDALKSPEEKAKEKELGFRIPPLFPKGEHPATTTMKKWYGVYYIFKEPDPLQGGERTVEDFRVQQFYQASRPEFKKE